MRAHVVPGATGEVEFMDNIARYAPILGAFNLASGTSPSPRGFPAAIGNLEKPRYAFSMADSDLGWTQERRGTALVLAPSGRVDESTADAFRERLVEAVETGPDLAIIDLSGIEYMSSRGLRALTLAQRAGQPHGTTIILARPGEAMREILAISRYDMVFKVTDTIEDATAN